MPETVNIVLSPEAAADPHQIQKAIARQIGRAPKPDRYRIVRRSIDARKKEIRVNLSLRLFTEGEAEMADRPVFDCQDVRRARPVIIVGAGPAGLFAALRLMELGLRPIVVERGRNVERRRKDVAALNRRGILDAESNYAFGEGGAGTFSDGKLYTRSKKRGDHGRVLHRFVAHGADEEILVEAQPHIGSNRLPGIVAAMRATINAHGGACLFEKKMTGLCLADGRATGVVLDGHERLDADAVILATGHSATDVYQMLAKEQIAIQAKPFAMGVRVEHPQALIDRIQYHGRPRGAFLPAASYRLVRQVDGRGVYSFCMCPGGVIVPAATGPNSMVVNGMSFANRNSGYANAGIVVEVQLADIPGPSSGDPLAGLRWQQQLEEAAYANSGEGMAAPAQRLADFVANRPSRDLPACSYPPGVFLSNLHAWLPPSIGQRLQMAFAAFGRNLKGFVTNDAVVVGVESRTSSPVRIPRDPKTLQHVQVSNLFPCGEGAGYAGGIVSCAVDGERVAEAVVAAVKA